MCTVTVVPHVAGPAPRSLGSAQAESTPIIRLVCNRDELRTRPKALPPLRRMCGEHAAIMPIDPTSDGTWIGANDAGLLVTLLNRHRSEDTSPSAARKLSMRSRGEIIPGLLSHSTLADALASAASLDPQAFQPFRLLLLCGQAISDVVNNGRSIEIGEIQTIDCPLLFTSSGLGDERVESPRRGLFEGMFAKDDDPEEIQDAFHAHIWPDRPHLSVLMSREEARTVSRTVASVTRDAITLSYEPIGGDASEDIQVARLPIERVAACR